jgi:hypothetical protein
MRYEAFVRLVAKKGWTLGQLRCDVRPTEELLEAMTTIGLDRWERFVLRWERASARGPCRMKPREKAGRPDPAEPPRATA